MGHDVSHSDTSVTWGCKVIQSNRPVAPGSVGFDAKGTCMHVRALIPAQEAQAKTMKRSSSVERGFVERR